MRCCVASLQYDRALTAELLPVCRRFWPGCGRYLLARKIGAAVMLSVGIVLLLGFFSPFHVALIYFAFPPLLLAGPVLTAGGAALWPRLSSVHHKLLFLARKNGPFTLDFRENELEVTGPQGTRQVGYAAIRDLARTDLGYYLFLTDGRVIVVPVTAWTCGEEDFSGFLSLKCNKKIQVL